MTTPPVEPVPQTNEPIPADVPTPVPDTTATHEEIRSLASTLGTAIETHTHSAYPTVPKGVVSAITLPTISVTLEGDTQVIPGVVLLDSYSPVVGDTVLIMKVGGEFFALGQINDANQGGSGQGWATLTESIQYRLIIDNGDNKVQMKGSASYTSSLGTLPTGFRPSVNRQFTVNRNGNAAAMTCTINTSGAVTLSHPSSLGGTTSSDAHTHTLSHSHIISHTHGGTTDLRLCGYLSLAGSDLCHSHAIFTGSPSSGSTGSQSSSTTSSDGHTHTVDVDPTDPTTVWFDDVEFFL